MEDRGALPERSLAFAVAGEERQVPAVDPADVDEPAGRYRQRITAKCAVVAMVEMVSEQEGYAGRKNLRPRELAAAAELRSGDRDPVDRARVDRKIDLQLQRADIESDLQLRIGERGDWRHRLAAGTGEQRIDLRARHDWFQQGDELRDIDAGVAGRIGVDRNVAGGRAVDEGGDSDLDAPLRLRCLGRRRLRKSKRRRGAQRSHFGGREEIDQCRDVDRGMPRRCH